jgi:hypothetical protein
MCFHTRLEDQHREAERRDCKCWTRSRPFLLRTASHRVYDLDLAALGDKDHGYSRECGGDPSAAARPLLGHQLPDVSLEHLNNPHG